MRLCIDLPIIQSSSKGIKVFLFKSLKFLNPQRWRKFKVKGETRRSSQLRSHHPDSNIQQAEDKAFHNSFFCVFYTR